MGKVSKPVPAVASVAISHHCSLSLMSHEWGIIATSTLPLSFSPVSTNGVNVWFVTWVPSYQNVAVVL